MGPTEIILTVMKLREICVETPNLWLEYPEKKKPPKKYPGIMRFLPRNLTMWPMWGRVVVAQQKFLNLENQGFTRKFA